MIEGLIFDPIPNSGVYATAEPVASLVFTLRDEPNSSPVKINFYQPETVFKTEPGYLPTAAVSLRHKDAIAVLNKSIQTMVPFAPAVLDVTVTSHPTIPPIVFLETLARVGGMKHGAWLDAAATRMAFSPREPYQLSTKALGRDTPWARAYARLFDVEDKVSSASLPDYSFSWTSLKYNLHDVMSFLRHHSPAIDYGVSGITKPLATVIGESWTVDYDEGVIALSSNDIKILIRSKRIEKGVEHGNET